MANTVAPTAEELVAFCNELSCYDNDELVAIIARASCRVNADFFGGLYHEAMLLMASHLGMLTLNGGATPQGPISSKKVGDLALTYNTTGGNDIPTYYALSRFGIEYYQLVCDRNYKAGMTVI